MGRNKSNSAQLQELIHQRFLSFGVRFLKRGRMPLAIGIISLAIVFSMFRALTPWATQYKGEVERHLTTLLGQPVVIQSMETSWYWFEPVLKLNQVVVSDNHAHVLTLNKLLVGINLLSSLWHWQIQPGILYLDDFHLTLRQVDSRWQIDGLLQDKQVTTLDSNAYLPVISWILSQHKIILRNVSALIHLNNGALVPLSGLNLTATNWNGHYRLKGAVKLAQTTPTEVVVLADMTLNKFKLAGLSGNAYFSVRHFLPSQWQAFFPKASYHLEGGKGGFEVWFDVAKGRLTGLQTNLHFRRMFWGKTGSSKNQFIQFLKANLAWKPNRNGWQLSGDQVALRADGIEWPTNSFLLDHNLSEQSYRLFVKNVLLEPFLASDITWPELIKPLLEMHLTGQLHDTLMDVRQGQIESLLTRFSGLSWQGKDRIPAVSNLSGAFHWQPTTGRLDLDGENTIIVPDKQLPPLTFADVNASIEWKELSHGYRISMDRLLLSRPDFVFSARGVLDEPLITASRHLQLTAEFSGTHATSWLAYVPTSILKPKLNDWLKQDIKRIDTVSGQVRINGPWADFPFDKQPGDFSITSHLSGVDLFFNTKWPLCQDIEANLRVDKRTLESDIFHANLRGVSVSELNLRLDDLGLDKEILLVHGKADAPANTVKSYVLNSPLKKVLSKLEQSDWQGPLALDLRLEVPLYTEQRDILARGDLLFNDNQVTFQNISNKVTLGSIMGLLKFDEHGIRDSELKAKALGEPLLLHLQSLQKPRSATEIMMDGYASIEAMRDLFHVPLLSVMQGRSPIKGKITFSDDPTQFDHVQLTTSMQGVSVDLPAPFGKTADDNAPLTLDVDFNSDKETRLGIEYQNRFSSDLRLMNAKGTFLLDKGEIRLGTGQAIWNKQPGIRIVGSLPTLNVEEWRAIYSKIPQNPSLPNAVENLQWINLHVGQFSIWGKTYEDMGIKAHKISENAWTIGLMQRDIAGNLTYQPTSYALSGHLDRLFLEKISLKQHNTAFSMLKPVDIPNLNLAIETFKLGTTEVGTVKFKSSSTSGRWHLDFCDITSPAYSVSLGGDWTQTEGKNKTELHSEVKITNLGEGLSRWQIIPAVEAHKGLVQLKGRWPGSVTDFSLEKVTGHLYIQLQNGRITHLSPETEEKLGLGKLLSILSLQTIPRRLKLDFSDLSHTGYSFDEFKGNFDLKKGVMHTDDSYIDGPVAYADMKGGLDVVNQLYDIELHVSPHITASLPVVATIAGGPIAGVAAWVASKIINQGMQTVSGYTYKISGPWLNPIVQQVSIMKKQPEKQQKDH